MKRRILALILSLIAIASVPLGLRAEPQPAVQALMHYSQDTVTCFDAAQTRDAALACVGRASTLCMDTEPDGYSTVGMMFCTLAEYEQWDQLLNRAYQTTMDGLRAMDTEEAEFFPEFANRADSLRTAQRAWIGFRDGECGLAYAMWGSGSMRQIAGASCLMEMTAERAISVRFLGDTMR